MFDNTIVTLDISGWVWMDPDHGTSLPTGLEPRMYRKVMLSITALSLCLSLRASDPKFDVTDQGVRTHTARGAPGCGVTCDEQARNGLDGSTDPLQALAKKRIPRDRPQVARRWMPAADGSNRDELHVRDMPRPPQPWIAHSHVSAQSAAINAARTPRITETNAPEATNQVRKGSAYELCGQPKSQLPKT